MKTLFALALIEVLLMCALLLTLAVALTFVARIPASELAEQVAHAVGAARLEAVLRGTTTCLAVPYPGVHLPPRGLLFTPDGLPRTCDGGGVGNTTILLEHRGRQAAVLVSSLGRVRWELR